MRRTLLLWARRVERAWDPFRAAWLLYALGWEEQERLAWRLASWAAGREAWEQWRSIAPLCFLALGDSVPFPPERLLERIGELKRLERLRISPLRDPAQVFPMALFLARRFPSSPEVEFIGGMARREALQGVPLRRALFAAAARELSPDAPVGADLPDDSIGGLWFRAQYGGLSPSPSEILRALRGEPSFVELCLLYRLVGEGA